jgi:cell division protein FtsL
MSKSTIESVVIFIILIIGIVGVISIIRPAKDAYVSPGDNRGITDKPYSLSQQKEQKASASMYVFHE